MDNVTIIINALLAKGKDKIRIPQQYFRTEIRLDSEKTIEFYATIFAPKVIKVDKNIFGNSLLIFSNDTAEHNISWVSDKDTKTILTYINNLD